MDVAEITARHPALVHTGTSRTHLSALLKAVEILDALKEARSRTLTYVWGYDPDVTNKEHHSGRALDFMVYSDRAAGDWIADYVTANAERLGLIHIIWYQRIWRGPYSTSTNPKGIWQDMADRGSATQNHLDHPHVWFTDAQYVPPDTLPTEEEIDMTVLEDILAEIRLIREAIAPGATTSTTTKPATTTTTTTRATTTTTTTRGPATTTTTTTPRYVPANEIGMLLRVSDPRMRGTAVSAAQRRLTLHGQAVDNDSIYGPGTEAAIKAFQASKGLTADGVVGEKTWAALLSPTRAEGMATARRILPILGWTWSSGPMTDARLVQAIKDFQWGWNLGPQLEIDGVPGAKTVAALELSAKRRAEGKTDFSPHFSAREFMCKCGGQYSDCRRIWVERELVNGAEAYRTISGPFTPLSACRCELHNKKVGGRPDSPHKLGQAFDMTARFSVARIAALRLFTNIGYNRVGGTVRHVDIRRTRGSKTNPHTFPY